MDRALREINVGDRDIGVGDLCLYETAFGKVLPLIVKNINLKEKIIYFHYCDAHHRYTSKNVMKFSFSHYKTGLIQGWIRYFRS